MAEDYGNDFITLLDEDGNEIEFEHIDTVEYNDGTYVALIPADSTPDNVLDEEGELVILKVVEDENGEEILATIEDDAEYDDVLDLFADRLEEYYEIEEE